MRSSIGGVLVRLLSTTRGAWFAKLTAAVIQIDQLDLQLSLAEEIEGRFSSALPMAKVVNLNRPTWADPVV